MKLCDIVPIKRFASVYPIIAREGYWFGFHDKSPWSQDNSMLLGHKVIDELSIPSPNDLLTVGYFSGKNCNHFKQLGKTHAWNWQQGAMLQWVGCTDNILFNDYDGEKHIARIIDINGKTIHIIQKPIAALSSDGQYGLTYDFARLRHCPHGYGYANGVDQESGALIPRKSGLSLINLKSGEIIKLFTVADIANIQYEPSMDDSFHYFSHCQFAPSGSRFKFFHRWTDSNKMLHTRMFTCDLDGNDLFFFPTSEMVSHVGWQDDQHILAYARTATYGDRYYLFTDKADDFTIIGSNVFSSDGHPSFSRDGRWFVTDTYPDRFRLSYLIVYDMYMKKRYNLAKLYSPRMYTETSIDVHLQCDLHPRWSRDNSMICFDSVYTGKRSLCTLSVGTLSENELISM